MVRIQVSIVLLTCIYSSLWYFVNVEVNELLNKRSFIPRESLKSGPVCLLRVSSQKHSYHITDTCYCPRRISHRLQFTYTVNFKSAYSLRSLSECFFKLRHFFFAQFLEVG